MSARGTELGVALIGCGGIARFAHARTLRRQPGVRVIAACDPDASARAAAVRAVGGEAEASWERVLERADVAAVVISSPSASHAEQAVAACRAGKHVYLEKPLATDQADGEAVVSAAAAAGVHLVVGYNRRLHPAAQAARSALVAGRIGELRGIRSTFCEPPPASGLPDWKRQRATGGGVLLDLASHHTDLVRWLTGREFTSAAAHLESGASEQDAAWVHWMLEGGVHVQGCYAFLAGPLDVIELIGAEGVLAIDRVRGVATLRSRRARRYGLGRARPLTAAGALTGRMRRFVQPAFDDSYRRSLAAFLALAAGDSSRDAGELASATDGLHALRAVLDAEAVCAS